MKLSLDYAFYTFPSPPFSFLSSPLSPACQSDSVDILSPRLTSLCDSFPSVVPLADCLRGVYMSPTDDTFGTFPHDNDSFHIPFFSSFCIFRDI